MTAPTNCTDFMFKFQTEKFYFAHKRSFSPENFVQKCRKLSQIIRCLIRWSGFSLVDDPHDYHYQFIIINIEHSWQVSLDFLMICADFAQFSVQFFYTEEFCADFCNYKNFCAGNLFPPKAKLFSLVQIRCF